MFFKKVSKTEVRVKFSPEKAPAARQDRTKYNTREKRTLCPVKRKTIQRDFQFSLATETMVLEKDTISKVLLRQPNNPKDERAVSAICRGEFGYLINQIEWEKHIS